MRTLISALALSVMVSCTGDAQQSAQTDQDVTTPMPRTDGLVLTSEAFADSGMIPIAFTCDSIDISPPLRWSGVPDSAVSLALIMDDPDAPRQTWVHWVIYNIPPDTGGFDAHVPADSVLSNGAKQGMSDFRQLGYGGPCPPSGTHRYVFKLYALDTMLGLGAWATKQELLDAMEGHVIASGQLVGLYARRK